MRFFRRSLFLLTLVLSGAISAQADDTSPTLARWNEILDQAGSLQEFLNSKDLKDRYFEAISQYFGQGNLTRVSYDGILSQLSELSKIPDVAEAIWKKRSVGKPFSLSYIQGPGAELQFENQQGWDTYLATYEKGLRQKAGSLLAITQAKKRRAEIAERIGKIRSQESEFQQGLNARTDRSAEEIKEARKANQAALRDSVEVQELVAYGHLTRIQDHELFQDALHSGNANAAKEAIKRFQDDFAGIFKLNDFELAGPIPKILKDVARDTVPRGEAAFFKQAAGTGAEVQVFYEVNRPFHAIWRGTCVNECVGGGKGNEGNASPQRYLVPALQGTEIRYAELHGQFRGFTEAVPVRHVDTGKVYGSLILGHPGMGKQIYVSEGEGRDNKVKSTLYDLWLRNVPAFKDGYILGTSTASDNAGVTEKIRRTASYQLGGVAGSSSSLANLPENESLARSIVVASAPAKYGYGERGQMIFDAMLPKQYEMTVLRQISDSEFTQRILSAPDEEKVAILGRLSLLDKGQRAKYFKDVRTFLKDSSEAVRARAAMLFHVHGDRSEAVTSQLVAAIDAKAISASELSVFVLHPESTDNSEILAAVSRRVGEIEDVFARLVILKSEDATASRYLSVFEKELSQTSGNELLLSQLKNRYPSKPPQAGFDEFFGTAMTRLTQSPEILTSVGAAEGLFLLLKDQSIHAARARELRRTILQVVTHSFDSSQTGMSFMQHALQKRVGQHPDFKSLIEDEFDWLVKQTEKMNGGAHLIKELVESHHARSPKIFRYYVENLHWYGASGVDYLIRCGVDDPEISLAVAKRLAALGGPGRNDGMEIWTILKYLNRVSIDDPDVTEIVMRFLRTDPFYRGTLEEAILFFAKNAKNHTAAYDRIAHYLELFGGIRHQMLTLSPEELRHKPFTFGTGVHKGTVQPLDMLVLVNASAKALRQAQGLSPAALKDINKALTYKHIPDFFPGGVKALPRARKSKTPATTPGEFANSPACAKGGFRALLDKLWRWNSK